MKSLILFFMAALFFLFLPILCANAQTTYDGNSLDVGIYWYGKGNLSEKFIEGQSNTYFNPSKPTMIYIHGWQKDQTKTLHRETLNPIKNNSSKENADVNCADYWIDKGWNIGIFYWNQLADESTVNDAEAKIWSINGSKKMRWRKRDSSYVEDNTPQVSVSELFIQQYVQAMKNFSGSEIRIAGHSLGNQIAINATYLISNLADKGQIKQKLVPNRVALLDPFYTKYSKSYLNNKWVGQVCREYVKSLKNKGIVFEEYKSSNINDFWIGDSNEGMKQLTAFVDVYPDYLYVSNQRARHGASRDLYFYSMAFNAPVEIENNKLTGKSAGYASTSTERIREMMNSSKKWIQKGGKKTNTPKDDTFEVVNK